MKHLYGILVLLICSTPVLAQQLVPMDDTKDPCRNFKMRVLAPPDFDRAMVAKPNASIDPKMVLNPCQSAKVDLPAIVPDTTPNHRNNFVIIVPGTPRPQLKFVPIQPAPFLNPVPKLQP